MNEQEVIYIDDIVKIIKRRKWILVVVPLIFLITGVIINYLVLTPIYFSSSTLIVNKSDPDDKIKYNDLMISNQLVSSYSEIAKSKTVIDKVLMNENITPEEFRKKLNIEQVTDTLLIEISVEDTDPVRAARLANKTAADFIIRVNELIKVETIQLLDLAEVPIIPKKPYKKFNIIGTSIIGIIIASGLVILLECLNQTIKSSEDIKRHLDLPIMGVIPKY